MGTIWVKEFTGGLDTRRLPETSPGGVLIKARNGHITRGGEFEQRAAFLQAYTLPADTFGLVATRSGLVVFGSAPAPTMPAGVAYQRLQHPDATPTLTRVLSADVAMGKIYVAAEFSDGAILHFYDGAIVSDWFDGRARATFTITGGTTPGTDDVTNIKVGGVAIISAPVAWTSTKEATAAAVVAAINSAVTSPDYEATVNGAAFTIISKLPGSAANGRIVEFTLDGIKIDPVSAVLAGGSEDVNTPATFTITGGNTNPGASAVGSFRIASTTAGTAISGIHVEGTALISAPVTYAGTPAQQAAAVVVAINALTGTSGYSATSAANIVYVRAVAKSLAPNGKAITVTTPTVRVGWTGRDDDIPVYASMTVDSFVSLSGGASPETSSIQSVKVGGAAITTASIPWATSHQATAAALVANINGNSGTSGYSATRVGAQVILTAAGVVAPSTSITFDLLNGLTISPSSLLMPETPITYQPGDFVRTVGQKVYSVAGPNLHFSGIKTPTKWTTYAVGAGFIDMSSENSSSDPLTAVARYQDLLAVFSDRVIQTWFIDPDPALNRHAQTMENTGTSSPRSVTNFGDADVFYLDESGLRSMRARDSSNTASTNDIGVAVDSLITAKLATLSPAERRQVVGLIEPTGGRFWLVMKDQIFVFSFFGGSKISAWTTYDTTYRLDGETVVFDVTDAVVLDRRVYLRSADEILVYGGSSGDLVHDDTEAEAWLPYLDANDPTRKKQFSALDVALRGVWRVAAAMTPDDEAIEDDVAVATRTTYNIDGAIPFQHWATHVSLRLRTQGVGPHTLSACVIHYEGSDDDD